MSEVTYDSLSQEALVHLLETSPFVGKAWRKDVPLPITILPAGGPRTGHCKMPPALLVLGLVSGAMSRSQLRSVFQLNQLLPGMEDIEVKAQQFGTGLFPKHDFLKLSLFANEATRSLPLEQPNLAHVFETLASWSDLLYPEGKAESAGKSTSFAGTGASAQAMASGEDIIDGAKLGNPWKGSNFTANPPGPFVVNEDNMYHEIFKGGTLWWRNGEIVDAGVAIGEAKSKSEKAEVIKVLVDELAS